MEVQCVALPLPGLCPSESEWSIVRKPTLLDSNPNHHQTLQLAYTKNDESFEHTAKFIHWNHIADIIMGVRSLPEPHYTL
jgi:hypothetical protein